MPVWHVYRSFDVPPTGALPHEDSDDNFATLFGPGGEVAPVTQHLGSKGVMPVAGATSPLRHCPGGLASASWERPSGAGTNLTFL